MNLKKIRLELARTPEHPQGSPQHGYEFVAPLDGQGHIDAEGWKASRARCRVHRFWDGEEDMTGHLVHRPGGSWAFHYDIKGGAGADDESGYRFANHAFLPGEYVSIREADDDLVTFVVRSVSDLPGG